MTPLGVDVREPPRGIARGRAEHVRAALEQRPHQIGADEAAGAQHQDRAVQLPRQTVASSSCAARRRELAEDGRHVETAFLPMPALRAVPARRIPLRMRMHDARAPAARERQKVQELLAEAARAPRAPRRCRGPGAAASSSSNAGGGAIGAAVPARSRSPPRSPAAPRRPPARRAPQAARRSGRRPRSRPPGPSCSRRHARVRRALRIRPRARSARGADTPERRAPAMARTIGCDIGIERRHVRAQARASVNSTP